MFDARNGLGEQGLTHDLILGLAKKEIRVRKDPLRIKKKLHVSTKVKLVSPPCF